jgi:nitrogen fixation protein NifB
LHAPVLAGTPPAIDADDLPARAGGPRLGIRHLTLAAAPLPLIERRYRPVDAAARAVGVADVLRYVAVARRHLKGALVLEIDGPGDPLASPDTILRSLALLAEHHPDVLTGLVIDGPLLQEYVEELVAFGLAFVVVRLDAVDARASKRVVAGARFRGEDLARQDAATLAVEEGLRALRLARRHGIAPLVRFTLLPTVNAGQVGEVAREARAAGALRMDVVPHRPLPGAPLERAGEPTEGELQRARQTARRAFLDVVATPAAERCLASLEPARLLSVDLDELDALDVLRVLPGPGPGVLPAPVLPPRRTQLVAVATRDGTLVDTALAAAHLLRIYAVTSDAVRCLGARALPLDPRRRVDGVGTARDFLEALVGCRALVATHLTPRAVTLLEAVGIRAVAQGGPLEDVLDRVARGTVRHAAEGGGG